MIGNQTTLYTFRIYSMDQPKRVKKKNCIFSRVGQKGNGVVYTLAGRVKLSFFLVGLDGVCSI